MRSSAFFTTVPFGITLLQLGELEDLYYAACAKLKDLLSNIDLLWRNGFKRPDETYFTYFDPPLNKLGPVNIKDFRCSLIVHESILHSPELRSLLNSAVVGSRFRYGDRSYEQDRSETHTSTQFKAQHIQAIWAIDDNHAETRLQVKCGHGNERVALLDSVQGLQDTSNMSCAMIFGALSEKYRTSGPRESLEESSIVRMSTPEVPKASSRTPNAYYTSPYNLDERAKKLSALGGPEMPCICDPECICAPVCASDCTQNCLCEENALFARVTEGMNIDDLDVPDLVRRKRQGSSVSKSTVSFCGTSRDTLPEYTSNKMGEASAVPPVDISYGAMDEMQKQMDQQKSQIFSNFVLPEDLALRSMQVQSNPSNETATPGFDRNLFWDSKVSSRSRDYNLSYREALKQPFAVQCAYPPKRSSVARRLFSSRGFDQKTKKRTLVNSGSNQWLSGNFQAYGQAITSGADTLRTEARSTLGDLICIDIR